METFRIKEPLSWGWARFKERPWFYIGITLLVFVINAALGALADEELVGSGVIAGLGSLVGTVVGWWIEIGLVGIVLAVYGGGHPAASELFSQGGKTLWHYALASILYGLIVLGGLILLIVPGIIWGIKFYYYSYPIVQKGMTPIAALKESARITAGQKWTLFGFLIVIGLLVLCGALVFFVGVFVALPVIFLADVWVYQWISKRVSQEQTKVQQTPVPEATN